MSVSIPEEARHRWHELLAEVRGAFLLRLLQDMSSMLEQDHPEPGTERFYRAIAWTVSTRDGWSYELRLSAFDQSGLDDAIKAAPDEQQLPPFLRAFGQPA